MSCSQLVTGSFPRQGRTLQIGPSSQVDLTYLKRFSDLKITIIILVTLLVKCLLVYIKEDKYLYDIQLVSVNGINPTMVKLDDKKTKVLVLYKAI